jgi:tetratricopeptide (TPR) repeat protein
MRETEPEPDAVSLADVLDLSDGVDEDVPTVFDLPDEAEMETVSELGVPDDPDEAMAWLEQLAAQQGASLDELPTLAESDFDREATVITEMDSSETPTIIDFPTDDVSEVEPAEAGLDIPDDPDEAMAWLEQLAARQGANLEELPTVDVVPEMVTPVTSLAMEEEVEMISESEVDSEFEEALADLSDIDMPEDDDEALAWLAALTGETAEAQEEPAAYDETPIFDEPEPIEAYEAFDSGVSDEFELFELPSLDLEETAEDDSILESIGEGTDLFLETPEELPAVTDSEFDDEELDSALPDWLKFGPTGETSREELDWLENFGESDVDSWLEAEEQITHYDMPAISDIAEPEPVASEPELLFDTGPLDETKAPVIEEFEVESLPSGPVDENELESARSALEIGDFDSALKRYNALLQSGQGLPMLIADLETASTRHTKVAPLQRLLGDAYMQNGQLQKAIDTYRRASDNL